VLTGCSEAVSFKRFNDPDTGGVVSLVMTPGRLAQHLPEQMGGSDAAKPTGPGGKRDLYRKYKQKRNLRCITLRFQAPLRVRLGRCLKFDVVDQHGPWEFLSGSRQDMLLR